MIGIRESTSSDVDGAAPMFVSALTKRFPSADKTQLQSLAAIWSVELSAIKERMFDLSAGKHGRAIPIEARADAIFQLAHLSMHLVEKIIDKKVESSTVENIDPAAERAALGSALIRERIEGTARICAQYFWDRHVLQWRRQYPLILTPAGAATTRFSARVATVAPSRRTVNVQHYVLAFSNEYFATDDTKQIQVYVRSVDGGIVSARRSFRKWGRAKLIYSQQLEERLARLENDAKPCYDKLLNLVPLSESEERRWCEFILAQAIRTPYFIRRNLQGLRRLIRSKLPDHPSDIRTLQGAVESLFGCVPFLKRFQHELRAREWRMLIAQKGSQFVRADEPACWNGAISENTWHIIYPMTPSRCLVVGPTRVGEKRPVVPVHNNATAEHVAAVNVVVASYARRSVITLPQSDDSRLRSLLSEAMGEAYLRHRRTGQDLPVYWDEL